MCLRKITVQWTVVLLVDNNYGFISLARPPVCCISQNCQIMEMESSVSAVAMRDRNAEQKAPSALLKS